MELLTVERLVASDAYRNIYLNLRSAFRRTTFSVEDLLHDVTALRQLSRAEILSEPLCPVGRLAMVNQLSL